MKRPSPVSIITIVHCTKTQRGVDAVRTWGALTGEAVPIAAAGLTLSQRRSPSVLDRVVRATTDPWSGTIPRSCNDGGRNRAGRYHGGRIVPRSRTGGLPPGAPCASGTGCVMRRVRSEAFLRASQFRCRSCRRGRRPSLFPATRPTPAIIALRALRAARDHRASRGARLSSCSRRRLFAADFRDRCRRQHRSGAARLQRRSIAPSGVADQDHDALSSVRAARGRQDQARYAAEGL